MNDALRMQPRQLPRASTSIFPEKPDKQNEGCPSHAAPAAAKGIDEYLSGKA